MGSFDCQATSIPLLSARHGPLGDVAFYIYLARTRASGANIEPAPEARLSSNSAGATRQGWRRSFMRLRIRVPAAGATAKASSILCERCQQCFVRVDFHVACPAPSSSAAVRGRPNLPSLQNAGHLEVPELALI